ncbi:uroporphyrinogen-III synthase [Nitrosomonas eutropha]|uniref:Uroporphyrinogen-III synthase n=2 Tax=Nitrosomonas eutropha TaxID=916 RepID=A0ABX5M6X3_9PROT|nr:uroporphyrinogen-III synthase [Nitrosomonas eutropha]ABI59294.1 uroporphyrinogen-III synthase [Nitrosomonas eutropha C91]PXV81081.1 uroporphyrinogen-III synthase [Nitrosomonas eutropha]SEI96828.1 uroporphyrinogen-III synthase [Nitrosomonas eutropha]
MALDRLAGKSILITRPLHQAGNLAARIKGLGGEPWLFPVLEISDSENKQPLLDMIARLDDFDLAVFVSPNAVERVMPLVHAERRWPEHVRVATVGKGSARALEHHGIPAVIVPEDGSDSEALLRVPQLQIMQGKRIIIFRGNGGRKLLGDTLRDRGASVDYVECYRRHRPEVDPLPLLKYWHDNGIQAVVISSSEGLDNLFDMIGKTGQQLLRATAVFTAHDRIECKARELGIRKIYRTPLGDEGTVQGLLEYFEKIQSH